MQFVEEIIIVLATAFSSAGFWAFIQFRRQGKSATDRLLMGLAYEKLVLLGEMYLTRGWISRAELADIHKYLYEPYKELGGNGTVEHIMHHVEQLPLRNNHGLPNVYQIVHERETQNA